MSATPEERERELAILEQMFGNDPFLDARFASLDPSKRSSTWFVDDMGFDPGPKFTSHDYEVRCGKAVVNLRLLEKWAFLEWRSELPGVLDMAMDMKSYGTFLDFVLQGLPAMLYGFRDDEAREYYTSRSRIDLAYRKQKNGFSTKTYRTDSLKDRISAIAEIVTDRDNILSLSATGDTEIPGDPTGENSKPFNLSVYIPNLKSITPVVYLGIPLTHRTVKGWNEEVLGWALSTHVDRRVFSNFSDAVVNLKDQITPIIGASLPQISDV